MVHGSSVYYAQYLMFLGAKRLSVRPAGRPAVHPSVPPSLRRSVAPSLRYALSFSAVFTCFLAPRGQYWLLFRFTVVKVSCFCMQNGCIWLITSSAVWKVHHVSAGIHQTWEGKRNCVKQFQSRMFLTKSVLYCIFSILKNHVLQK